MVDTTANTEQGISFARIARVTGQGLLGVALVMMIFYLVVYVAYAANLIQFPYDYDQGEGFELHDVMMFSRGEFPYANIETYPFYGSIYPPLYHVILVPLAWIFGPALWYGRLYSFLTTLVTTSVIVFAVYKQATRDSDRHKGTVALIAGIAGLAWLASPIVYHIGPLFRQHIGMVMFELLGIAVLGWANTLDDTSRRRRYLLLGFALLIAAGYTKQLAAFTAIAALLYTFIHSPRRALVWGIGFALVGGLIFLGLNIATEGNWWVQTITANVKEFNLGQAEGLFRMFINLHFWLLIPAGLMVLYEVYFDRISIYSIWFVVTVGLNGYSAGTWGAGDSYYATPIAAACVLTGVFIARTFNGSWRFNANLYTRLLVDPLRRFAPILTMIGMIVLPLTLVAYGRDVLHMPTNVAPFEQVADILGVEDNTGYGYYDPDGYITFAYAQIGHFLTDADRAAGDEIVALMDAIPDDVLVLSEEAGFTYAADREVITNPVVLKILWEAGAFDSSALVELIDAQTFGMIVLRAQFYPEDVNRAITINYEEDRRIIMNGFAYIIKYPRETPLEDLPQSVES